MIPVTVKVRSLGENNAVRSREGFPLQRLRAAEVDALPDDAHAVQLRFRPERIHGRSHLPADRQGGAGRQAATSRSPPCRLRARCPCPRPCCWPAGGATSSTGCILNAVKTPKLKRVSVTVDLLPERRVATIENAWVANSEVRAGDDVPVKVFLRPIAASASSASSQCTFPPGSAKGEHRILLSDADTAQPHAEHGRLS